MSITVNTAMWARTSINRAVCCCGAANVTEQSDILACDQTTTSTSFGDTNQAITVPNRCGGKFMLSSSYVTSQSTLANNLFRITDDNTQVGEIQVQTLENSAMRHSEIIVWAGNTDGSLMNMEWRVLAGTGTLRANSRMVSLEVGGT